MNMQGSMRRAIVLWLCGVIVAQTSGLMLAVHFGSLDHPADHDTEDCSVCRQFCVLPKKFLLAPPATLVQDTHSSPAETPGFIEPVQDHHPRIGQARAPPCPQA
jgi:hypothetical protein